VVWSGVEWCGVVWSGVEWCVEWCVVGSDKYIQLQVQLGLGGIQELSGKG